MSELITLEVPVRDGDTITTHVVTGETTSNPHIAVTPTLGTGKALLVGGLTLTHIPTGMAIVRDSSLAYPLRDAVPILTQFGDWSSTTPLTPTDLTALRKALFDASSGDHWMWPEWAGDPSTPALSLIGQHLDTAANNAPLDDAVRNEREQIVDALNNPELAKRADRILFTGSVARYVAEFGLIYILSILHRIDSAAADRAARELVSQWEAGDALGEWMWQWRNELAQGEPLSLIGFPEVETVAT